LKRKYDELQHKRLLLVSRANVAKSIKQIQQTSVSFSSENIAKGISRAEDRILMMEAEVQAADQYDHNRNLPSADHVTIEMSQELEEELKKLKQDTKETA
jgi:phage shock protein A